MSAALPGLDHESNGIAELCPACQVEVPLVDITRAECENGHVWGTCQRPVFLLKLTPCSSMFYHIVHLGYADGSHVYWLLP